MFQVRTSNQEFGTGPTGGEKYLFHNLVLYLINQHQQLHGLVHSVTFGIESHFFVFFLPVSIFPKTQA